MHGGPPAANADMKKESRTNTKGGIRGEVRRRKYRGTKFELEPMCLAAGLSEFGEHDNSFDKKSTFIANALDFQTLTDGINDSGSFAFHPRLTSQKLFNREL